MTDVRRVLAVVIDFRTTAGTRALTCQLAGLKGDGIELVVAHVDNGNASPVALTHEQRRLGVRLVRNAHNGGYGSGARAAIAQIRSGGDSFDALWILNSDLQVDPECLIRLLAVLNRDPAVGAVGPTVYYGRTDRVWGARGVVSPLLGITAMTSWKGGELPRWSYIPGCALLARTKAYDEVGGIPDRYGMYYEETELCVRMQKRGWKLWVDSAARAYHAVDSMERGIPARYQAFYFTRNNLYFWQANFGIPWFVQLPRTLFVVMKDLVVPLRRAQTMGEAFDRLRFVAMGLADSRAFLRQRYTRFERRHFDLEPKTPTSEAR